MLSGVLELGSKQEKEYVMDVPSHITTDTGMSVLLSIGFLPLC